MNRVLRLLGVAALALAGGLVAGSAEVTGAYFSDTNSGGSITVGFGDMEPSPLPTTPEVPAPMPEPTALPEGSAPTDEASDGESDSSVPSPDDPPITDPAGAEAPSDAAPSEPTPEDPPVTGPAS